MRSFLVALLAFFLMITTSSYAVEFNPNTSRLAALLKGIPNKSLKNDVQKIACTGGDCCCQAGTYGSCMSRRDCAGIGTCVPSAPGCFRQEPPPDFAALSYEK